MLKGIWKKIQALKPVQVLTLGFLLLILIGSGLLMLPAATAGEGNLSFINALFTATSAVCVTGLTVVNTGLVFTMFGKIVLLFLIQIGGLGFMTVTSLLFMALGRRISLRERLLLQEAFNTDSLQGMVRLVRSAVLVTFTVEGAAALLLCLRLVSEYGSMGVFHAVFLSVSAFCNAGFDAFGFETSIAPYIGDPVINLVLMLLITLGGLGFAVIMDVLHNRRFGKLTFHSRVVLLMSGGLLAVGALLFGVLEWRNPATLGRSDLHAGEKILAAFFQSVTLRTAGFDAVGQGNLTPAGQLVSILYMFIGASPASTGGGLKTTTFFALMLSVSSIVRSKADYNFHRRRLSEQLVKKATALFVLALSLVIVDAVIISALEYVSGGQETMADILFEVVSAFGTVGLSRGITPGLHAVSKLMIIVTMFCGRVGLLTVSMALSGGSKKAGAVRYPEERVMIG